MMTIFAYYWPVLVVALLIGIACGVLAFRVYGSRPGS